MKASSYFLGAVVVVVGAAAACSSDDDASEPTMSSGAGGAAASGEAGTGGSTVATGGASQGGLAAGGVVNGGSAAGGSTNGGRANGGSSGSGGSVAGATSQGGGPDALGGAAGEGGQGGAAGEPVAESPPFTGPYAAVYAAPIEGVDTRFPKLVEFRAGGLVRWVSQLDEDHDMGSAKNLNVGLDGVVQWGRWADGKPAGNDAFTVNAKQGFHYALGALSAALPANGNQSYVLVGATPVTMGDGSVDVGTTTATARAAFGTATAVGVSIELSIGGVTYKVESTGGTATPATSQVTAWDAEHPARIGGVPPKPTTGMCADGCNLSVQGFFAGVNAAQLALVVHIFDGDGGSPTSLSSVMVLKKQ
ncbi:MAG TPA: hypothetical protein VHP33_24070 [Polyangiaceae bacterium]|nr:hypothetical protein [Polyangiaceae bacterium]